MGVLQEMKVWPFGVAGRAEASNHHMLRWLKTVVMSDVEKAPVRCQNAFENWSRPRESSGHEAEHGDVGDGLVVVGSGLVGTPATTVLTGAPSACR
jgi:hypothetical protein